VTTGALRCLSIGFDDGTECPLMAVAGVTLKQSVLRHSA
jgi:hypothetical protein